ncbi:MAG TPA: arabinofuranosidase catalytic domain-containing protein, partial [Steroidobacteraceae bacterium]
MRLGSLRQLALVLALAGVAMTGARAAAALGTAAHRPKGPCDVYEAAGDACVAAYSTTRAMYASYDGPLYQITRQSDGRSLNIGVVQPVSTPVPDAGGYADAAAQDAFCAGTYCWITKLYDQSPKHNDLTQAPRGGWSGPALGGMDNVPLAGMAPVLVMGHKVYGVFLEPGMGLRDDDPKGTAVDDQAEGEYWVVNGRHFNSGCCNDFGNAEIDSRDDDAGTMETTYFGDAPWWYHGNPPGPWVMTDQENNLVGCVNPDGSKLCARLPDIHWRFLTGIAKGEPHHWASMAGNAQGGPLSVMFSGPRVDWQYDPMRKQGGIVLGNGGDNSNGSQGTFYEGAMTAAGTFPNDATDQQVQANVAAAHYRMLPVSIAPASATVTPPGLQTFSPQSSQDTTVTFTNTTEGPVTHVRLSIALPSREWTSVVSDGRQGPTVFAGAIAPGGRVSATFRVTSGSKPFNGDLIADARWTDRNGREREVTRAEKVRNVLPIRINEFRIGTSSAANATNSFIELYNAGSQAVDISGWTLTEHPSQQAVFSTVRMPAGAKLGAGGFYLLGLADSGLAAPAHARDISLYVRDTIGMKAGDTLQIGTGAHLETRRIVAVGTAAGMRTTLWQPLPDGPIITIPAGSTNVPVQDTSGFVVGQKIALGYGATYPTVPGGRERYEIATVTAVGKPGTQAYLAADALPGATNIKVTAVRDISVGDKIRLDVDSVGHGIETVTVTKVGTAATITRIMGAARAGTTHVEVDSANDLTAGDKMIVATPAHRQTVTVTSVEPSSATGARVSFAPALRRSYPEGAQAIVPGTGLELAAPLRFEHAANLPFSDRGTGISFEPATTFAHISNDPIQPLGTGLRIDRPLGESHAIDAAVEDPAVTAAGYQGSPAPTQWFGGPELTTQYHLFDRIVTAAQGSMVLRDPTGLVVDSLNYGGLVDPWAVEGYQAVSGLGKDGCYVTAPGFAAGSGVSAGRSPDGANTDSNCNDFVTSPLTTLPVATAAGAANIKVASVEGFHTGQTLRIGSGADAETAVVASVGTPGATTARSAISAGATVIPVTDAREFNTGQTISIGSGAVKEMAVVSGIDPFDSPTITVASPFRLAHAVGAEISGTGIGLASPLTRGQAPGAPVVGAAATPGAPNRYHTGGGVASTQRLPFVSTIFGDNMVLQRGKRDTIWGWSQPGDSVHVQIEAASGTGVAGADGRWQVRIAPPPTGGPYTMKVTDGPRTAEFHDIMVGDVWICGGQSNMELPLRFTDDAAQVAKAASYPYIRYFTVGEHTAYRPTHTLEGSWKVVSPRTAGSLSAVAFYFGRKLERETHVPIGLVVDAVGGSAGESWASAAALRPLHDYDIPLAKLARFAAEGAPAYGNYVMHWYDEYDIGLKGKWYSPGYEPTEWKDVHLPGGFAELGIPVTPAVAWFRKEITLPDPLPKGLALLSLGEIQRMDSVYVNGTFVGGSAWVEHPRVYPIPPKVLKPGRNLIAVRIFKTEPHGGFLDGPSDRHLTLGDHTVVSLAGVWRGKISVDARPPHPMPIHFANWPVMPTVLYDGMLVPVAPLSVSGAIWYQGAQNSPRGYEYRKLLPAVIASWRGLFQQRDLPFYIVQLPAFAPHSRTPTDDGWADIRESQAIVAQTVPHSCLAVSIDTGDANSLHPGNKEPVGDRLALCALAHHYGKHIADSGPT